MIYPNERELAEQNVILLPIMFCIWIFVPIYYYFYVPAFEHDINVIIMLWILFIIPSFVIFILFFETLYKLDDSLII